METVSGGWETSVEIKFMCMYGAQLNNVTTCFDMFIRPFAVPVDVKM